MSFSYQKLNPIKVVDPILQVDRINDYAVLESGSKVSWKAYTSNSISQSSIQFSCPPPSANIIVDRCQRITLPVRLTFTGIIQTNTGTFTPSVTLLNAGKDAPRAFPFSSGLDTLQVSINNDSVSINMSDIVHAFTRYNIGTDVRSKDYSMTPNYPDQSSNYSDLDGTSRNPLGAYGNGFCDDIVPRGGFPFNIVSNAPVAATTGGAAATAVCDILIHENMFLSPFFWGLARNDNQGFYNVNAMDFNLTFLSQCGMRMWAHSDAPVATSGAAEVTSTITAISVQFNGFSSPAFSYSTSQPQMLFKYYSPNLLMPLSPSIPYSYPYSELTRFPTDIGTLAYSAGAQYFQSNNIQLNQIPRRMYIFARPANSVLQSRCDITDTFLAISNVSIQFANQNTVLSTATQAQLYDINTKNHSEQSWNEWSGQLVYNSAFTGTAGTDRFCGGAGPLCLEFGTDIQLESNEAPGLAGQYQIQVQAQLANMNAGGQWDALAMTLYLVFVNEGVFTITGTASAQHQLGVLSKMDILDAQSQPGLNYRTIQSYNGGDFWNTLANFGSKVNDFLKETKLISKVGSLIPHPVAQGISKGAEAFGYGHGGVAIGGVAIGGRRSGKKSPRRSRLLR